MWTKVKMNRKPAWNVLDSQWGFSKIAECTEPIYACNIWTLRKLEHSRK